ncbi:hypothetical protein [Actinomadura sp. 9N215]|uniref:hypothetical protein n=1 Tax=Actinomadura sp. 9N215 TaxID=3375150 RepID=UPI003789406B
MADERDEPRDREPRSWRIRRWAAPIAMAASVAASISAVHLLADDDAVPSGAPTGDARMPRFMLTVGHVGVGPEEERPAPWIRVGALSGSGRYRPVDSVRPPSSSAGEAREILDGPGGTFVIASTRDEPCESRLYRFGLTRDGHVTGLARLTGDVVPARVGGLAMTPDGDKIAYTTAPCGGDVETAPPPSADVTVLDLGSGRRRGWGTPGPALVGQIVWAEDGRTLGYVISDVRPDAIPGDGSGSGGPGERSPRDIGNATVHALDTEAKGADLRAGRVLFRQPDASTFVTSAVMGPDGRGGYGVLRKSDPVSTVFFSFAEGEPMRVTRTITPKPGVDQAVALVASTDPPRYACLSGTDPFGRALGGDLQDPLASPPCGAAYAY